MHHYKCPFLSSHAGITQTWDPHERLPSASVRELLTRYLDITTPPTPNFLHVLAEYAHDNDERTRLDQLATVHLMPPVPTLFSVFFHTYSFSFHSSIFSLYYHHCYLRRVGSISICINLQVLDNSTQPARLHVTFKASFTSETKTT